jgi:glycosyltransferase involved in cell wall biosynthesis
VNPLGYGRVGLHLTLALDGLGHSPALWPIGGVEAEPKYHERLRACAARSQFYDPKAPSLRVWHQFALGQHVGKGPHAALPIFELDRFTPAEQHHLKCQDIVFATCTWARDVLLDAGVPAERVCMAPLAVDHETFRAGAAAGARPNNTTVFLNVGKWEVRKGHDVLLEAFCKAFTPEDDVELAMLSDNPCAGPEYNAEWRRYYENSPMGDKVVVLGRASSAEDVAALMDSADCGVFPSRGEGWNLPLAEMMAMGKHAIATAYSAHLDYCTRKNALLIHIDGTEAAHDGVWFHGQGEWARLGPAQVDQLVEHLRAIHRRKQEGSLGANEQGRLTLSGFRWEETAKDIMSAFD